MNKCENTAEPKPQVVISAIHVNDKLSYNLLLHKSLIGRSESIGNMGYWEYDLVTQKIWASQGARHIYGIDNRELTMREIQNFVCSEYRPKLDLSLKNCITKYEKYDAEFRIIRQNDGATIDIRSLAEYDSSERKVYGMIFDNSKQKKIEHELLIAKERAEKSDMLKSAFVSNMSHEIRTPMNGIVGCVHILTEMEIDPETTKEYKEIIHKCCNQLLGTVNDMLEIANIESCQIPLIIVPINIYEVFKDVYETFLPLASKKNLDLKFNSPETGLELKVYTDQIKLKKVIINLVENAIRFTSYGYVEIGYREYKNEIEFFIKDTGTGITPDQQKTIFEPFCMTGNQLSSETEGTGLGLTITKKYISILGGKIWLESETGKGTTFFFSIPKTENKMKPVENLQVRKKANLLKTCLIVDDNEMNYLYLKALVSQLGFNHIWAKDGAEAIEMALSNESIDLVMMDIRLPVTDGYEATRIIKLKRPELIIIGQSANAQSDDRIKALESGCDDYLTKPIYKENFAQLVNLFFDS
jgi:signal transduction histidine kinase/CheY-like chemotaxis protein